MRALRNEVPKQRFAGTSDGKECAHKQGSEAGSPRNKSLKRGAQEQGAKKGVLRNKGLKGVRTRTKSKEGALKNNFSKKKKRGS